MFKNFKKLFILCFCFSLNQNYIFASNNYLQTSSNYEELKFKENEYLIDSGDILNISFSGLDFFSGNYSVNPEGNIILPEIGKIKISGKTKNEIKNELQILYSNYLYKPEIDVSISGYRPVNFYIRGEVKNPGLYVLQYSNLENIENINNNLDVSSYPGVDQFNLNSPNQSSIKSVPRLYEALKKSGGFTNYADLTNIEITRKFKSNDQLNKIISINLMNLLNKGDQSVNIRIYDGDSIYISRSQTNMKKQILSINRTNLSPKFITVFVTGNVYKQGPATLKQGSSLTQAIASTGGKKLLTGKIEFIRFNDDGSTNKSIFSFEPNAQINTKQNPILMDGDVINVRRTLLGKTTEIFKEISTPLLSGYALIEIFN